MCDLIPPLECPECLYDLPDEYEYDPHYEMDRADARDEHAINTWETAHDLGDDA